MATLLKSKNAPSLFTDFFGRDFFNDEFFTDSVSKWLPATNVKEMPDKYSLELAVPGMNKEDITVALEDDVLMIRGMHKEEKKEEGRYTRQEFTTSSFERTFRLPKSIAADQVDAKYENGILRLVLPKREEAKLQGPKEIRVS
jgi:HSP20 family protein